MSDWERESVESLKLESRPLEYLARESARTGNPFAEAASAEITRRMAQAQIDSAESQKKTVESAGWSIIFMAMMAFISAAFQFLSWVWPNPHFFH